MKTVKILAQKIIRNKLILVEVTFIFALVIISLVLLYSNSQKIEASDIDLVFFGTKPKQNTFTRKLSYISGQVTSPGVYELDEDTRLAELVEKAGGFTDKADIEFISKNINLSQKLEDEFFVYIPSIEEQISVPSSTNGANSQNLININTASDAELDTLPGIGPSTANKIIQSRPYNSIQDLLEVDGIGEGKFSDIENLITI